jgi:Transcriptional regulator
MDFHQIRYFAALAEARNYTAAAEKCYISRQALRQAVQSMEKEYGVALVENRRNRLYLTPAGELLAGWAKKLCADWDGMDAALRRFVSQPILLRLGISVSLLPFYAPEQIERLNRLREVFPSLELRHELADADALLRRLEAGELDAALVVDLGVERAGLLRTVLRRDTPGLLIADGHPLCKKKSLCLRDLDGQTLCLMSAPGDCFRPLQEALEKAGARVSFRVIPESIDAFRAVRKEGLLAIDRLELCASEPVSLEKDLPLTDFDAALELVLLLRREAAPTLQPVVRCLQSGLV